TAWRPPSLISRLQRNTRLGLSPWRRATCCYRDDRGARFLDARQFRLPWHLIIFAWLLRAWWHMQPTFRVGLDLTAYVSCRPANHVVRQTGSKESAQSRYGQNHDAPRERRQAGDNDKRLAD